MCQVTILWAASLGRCHHNIRSQKKKRLYLYTYKNVYFILKIIGLLLLFLETGPHCLALTGLRLSL